MDAVPGVARALRVPERQETVSAAGYRQGAGAGAGAAPAAAAAAAAMGAADARGGRGGSRLRERSEHHASPPLPTAGHESWVAVTDAEEDAQGRDRAAADTQHLQAQA
ncbi:uncharacterized protein KRP23_14645 [Phytophthora ramorum]|uniref:uncharacterized protein n=1 Tax=Phytophthora ramorum TaxID=164328 RepID=UPI00309CAF70|nr:hypothetical protein KRP23_14645 [Phytophthora ramorum]